MLLCGLLLEIDLVLVSREPLAQDQVHEGADLHAAIRRLAEKAPPQLGLDAARRDPWRLDLRSSSTFL